MPVVPPFFAIFMPALFFSHLLKLVVVASLLVMMGDTLCGSSRPQ